ncbi:MAG: hypothetical protein GX601_14250 [Anaerolineales bacterium]|nr:hypothetical protein [Anaerolineales bacterium]
MSVRWIGRGRWILALVIVLVGVFAGLSTARAVVFYDGERIPAGVVIEDDVFIVGNNVVVEGTVTGDLFAAGEEVVVSGTVGGSLFITGATLRVNGEVEGSVYGAGSSFTLGPGATVGRNGYVTGYSLETAEGSLITQDLLFSGYQAALAGTVDSDVRGAMAALELSGQVGEDVNVNVAAPGQNMGRFWDWTLPGDAPEALEPGLRVAETAQIGGQLIYTSPELQAEAIEAEPEGGVVFRPAEERARRGGAARVLAAIGRWLLARLRDLLSLLILGGLALWLIPTWLNRAADQAWSDPLLSLGLGLLVLIVGYVALFALAVLILIVSLLISLISVGGLAWPVFGIGLAVWGLTFIAFQLLVSWGSKLVVTYLVGRWLLGRISRDQKPSAVVALLLGVVIYVILRAIPILGWLVGAVATLIGLGAIWLLIYRSARRTQPSA